MTWIAPIESYKLFVFAKPARGYPHRNIHLIDGDGTVRANIYFRPDDEDLRDGNEMSLPDGKKMAIYFMHEYQYRDVVDLLRNEEPLYLLFIDPAAILIATADTEPVGENE